MSKARLVVEIEGNEYDYYTDAHEMASEVRRWIADSLYDRGDIQEFDIQITDFEEDR